MSVVVVGAAGQLGRDICHELGSRAVSLRHKEIELTDSASVRSVLTELRPEAVINTAAFNRVDDAESRPQEAFGVNAFGVRSLSEVCRDLDCLLVHFSTDYVFGLERGRSAPIGEVEAPGPVSVYGLSKLAGEYFVRTICAKHFVIRTCGLYGLHGSGGKGTNFVETMLRLGRERGQVSVVNDQRCTPTFTVHLAQATLELIRHHDFGLFHWTNSGDCSWHEFACEIFRQADMDVQCKPISTAEFAARAARPKYSVLATEKIQRLGLPAPRPWREALREYLALRTK